MLALQIVFRASFQPVDLEFYIASKVLNSLAQVSIIFELATVSLEIYQGSDLITRSATFSSRRASTINNEPHKKSQNSLRRDKSAVMLRSIVAG